MSFKEKMKKRVKLTVRQGRRRKQGAQEKERMLEINRGNTRLA